MRIHWIDALIDALAANEAAVLVTVAHVEGSAPREAGTSFVVTEHDSAGTIGGGHLEFEAIALARRHLFTNEAPLLTRYALGPSLGQCCGGVVWLLHERVPAADRGIWMERAVALSRDARLARRLAARNSSQWHLGEHASAGVRFDLQGESWTFEQDIGTVAFPVMVFGAGHVGEAIVRALAPIEADITWVDSREEAFPSSLPRNVQACISDTPEDEIRRAPPGSYFLVLTHSHDLDLRLCEKILARDDFAFFGLIGSKSKRARFQHRLAARGLDTQRMVCPIGIPGIAGKAPAIIAVAVAAQLAQVREAALQQKPETIPVEFQ